jgi:steroid delta-isomerase-like uncharacterized protein
MDRRIDDRLIKILAGSVPRREVLRRLESGVLVAGGGLMLSRASARAQATPADFADITVAWTDAWNSHDGAQVAALFTADSVYEDMAFGLVSHGTAEIESFANGLFTAIPDTLIELTAGFVAGDWAGAEWVFSGTDHGVFPGREPSGKTFAVRGGTIFTLSEGKIQRNTDYYNLVTVQEQLGVIPGAGTPTS